MDMLPDVGRSNEGLRGECAEKKQQLHDKLKTQQTTWPIATFLSTLIMNPLHRKPICFALKTLNVGGSLLAIHVKITIKIFTTQKTD